MRIIQLTAQNIKRIKAIDITPEKHMNVIGGKNAAGKSSVLDLIMAGLAGGKHLPEVAIREGQEKGFVEIEIGDVDEETGEMKRAEFTVRRTFTASGGGSLTVTAKNGDRKTSQQAFLDAHMGRVFFDPLKFARDVSSQVPTLQALVGLDFTAHEAERSMAYQRRTASNSRLKDAKARLAGISEPTEIAPERVSIQDLLDRIDQAQNANRDRSIQLEEYRQADKRLLNDKELLEDRLSEIKVLQDCIATQEAEISKRSDLPDSIPTEGLKKQIRSAEETNERVRVFEEMDFQISQLTAEIKKQGQLSQEATTEIDRLDATKRKAIDDAGLPVEGLSFGPSSVLYNDLPFSQASDAETVRVSTAIGMATNPILRLMLIREGSLLDDDNLALIGEMAIEEDYQIFVERVGHGPETTIIMVDGEVQSEAARRIEVNKENDE